MQSESRKFIGFYSRKEDYGWLSNFHRADQVVDSIRYPTNEHYYQSQKAVDESIKLWIASAPAPFLAMKAGRNLRPKEFRPDWESVKLGIMYKGLKAKFIQNPDLQKSLIDTGDAFLFEDSSNDRYWGMVKGTGENHLGDLLMRVRKEIILSPFPKQQYEYGEIQWVTGMRHGDPLCPLCGKASPKTGLPAQSIAPNDDPTGMIIEHACPVHGTFDVNWS